MLLNNFFTNPKILAEGNVITTSIKLNVNHAIFKGHFPEQAVLPGVCMLQIIKEIIEVYTGDGIILIKGADLKFLSLVKPSLDQELGVMIELTKGGDLLQTNARLTDGATILFKFKGTFKVTITQ